MFNFPFFRKRKDRQEIDLLKCQVRDLSQKIEQAAPKRMSRKRFPVIPDRTVMVYASITERSMHYRIYIGEPYAQRIGKYDFLIYDYEEHTLSCTNSKTYGVGKIQVLGNDLICVNSRRLVEQIFATHGIRVPELGRVVKYFMLEDATPEDYGYPTYRI